MEKIKTILLKIKTKRYTVDKAKVYVTKNVENSSENNALSNKDEEAFAINLRLLDRKLSLLE
jgi:hypothetical protein